MTTTNEHIQCFAIRQVNPFLGVMQIVQAGETRAFSNDAYHWEIQTRILRPDDLWGGKSQGTPVYRYIRFGTWNRETGLERVPANPLLNLSDLFERTEIVIKQLIEIQDDLPLKLIDRYELWLLDGQSRLPLAMLHSTTLEDQTRLPHSLKWHASEPTNRDFPSPGTDQLSPPHPRDNNPHPHLSKLTKIIHERAGHTLAQWFLRKPDGSGTALPVEGFPELSDRTFAAEVFPEKLLQEASDDPLSHSLIQDYLQWIAPQLLTLQHLSDGTRLALERQAVSHASRVDKLWRLYPKILQADLIRQARIEARIRKATSTD